MGEGPGRLGSGSEPAWGTQQGCFSYLHPQKLRGTFGSHCGFKRHINIDVCPEKSFLWQQHTQDAAEPNFITRDTNLSIRGVPVQGTAHIPFVWPIKMFKYPRASSPQPEARLRQSMVAQILHFWSLHWACGLTSVINTNPGTSRVTPNQAKAGD